MSIGIGLAISSGQTGTDLKGRIKSSRPMRSVETNPVAAQGRTNNICTLVSRATMTMEVSHAYSG